MVPPLDTSFIGTFAYFRPATSIQLADALPYFYVCQQFGDYIDGVMRIWDTGSQDAPPNNYCDVYVRIRSDGWIMSFIPDDAHQGTACWNPYSWILGNYTNRGDLIWWGHNSDNMGNPSSNSTRIGRALSEIWDAVKTNSDTPTYTFNYNDISYYDYEHTTSTKLYIFGKTDYRDAWHLERHLYWYFTLPSGTTIQSAYMNYGYGIFDESAYQEARAKLEMNVGETEEIVLCNIAGTGHSNGYLSTNIISNIMPTDTQNVVHMHLLTIYIVGNYTTLNSGAVILANG